SGDDARQERNSAYDRRQAEQHKTLFHSGQGYPLNAQQVEAILHDEDRCLVDAGAGTGKTSTIDGKTFHLLPAGLAEPDEILLLAFTRKASEEMETRLRALIGQPPVVKTFHALGLQLVAGATGKKPTLSRLAESQPALATLLDGILEELAADPRHGV